MDKLFVLLPVALGLGVFGFTLRPALASGKAEPDRLDK